MKKTVIILFSLILFLTSCSQLNEGLDKLNEIKDKIFNEYEKFTADDALEYVKDLKIEIPEELKKLSEEDLGKIIKEELDNAKNGIIGREMTSSNSTVGDFFNNIKSEFLGDVDHNLDSLMYKAKMYFESFTAEDAINLVEKAGIKVPDSLKELSQEELGEFIKDKINKTASDNLDINGEGVSDFVEKIKQLFDNE